MSGVEVFGDGRAAVNQDDRDIRLFGFLKNRFPTGFHHRRNPNHVSVLGDEGANSFELVFLSSKQEQI